MANSGDTNTGAFNSGDSNNGVLERGNNKGQFPGFEYTISIPSITVTTGITGLDLPITLSLGGPTLNTIEINPLKTSGQVYSAGIGIYPYELTFPQECEFGICIPSPVPTISYMQPTPPGCTQAGGVPFCPLTAGFIDIDLGPILIGGKDGTAGVTQNGLVNVQIGGPNTTIGRTVTTPGSTITVVSVPASGPGLGNSTSTPSSGFFNSGPGGGSGFYNSGGGDSGVRNTGSGNSGIANSGGSLSGVANVNTDGSGSQGSGVRNTVLESVLAMVSGVGNVASADGNLAGWFRGATVPVVPTSQGTVTAGTGGQATTGGASAPITIWDVLGLSDAAVTASTDPVTVTVTQPLTTAGLYLTQSINISLATYYYANLNCSGTPGTNNYCNIDYTLYDQTTTSTITQSLTFPSSSSSSSAVPSVDDVAVRPGPVG